MQYLSNIAILVKKELASVMRDYFLIALMVFSFTVDVISAESSTQMEVLNASVGIVDYDETELSSRITTSLLPPYFTRVEKITEGDAAPSLDSGRFTFVLEIPPNLQSDLVAGRKVEIGLLVDATAMSQAGLGAHYLQEIVSTELQEFLKMPPEKDLPFLVNTRFNYNENINPVWSAALLEVITNVTILSIVLVGSAVIRERERGTIDHLLVLPLSPLEIVLSKIIANSMVVFICGSFSIWFVVHLWLGVPINGSLLFVFLTSALYVLSTAAFGLFLATVVRNMAEFALLVVPVYAIVYLLSGAATPVENMPAGLQSVVGYLPTNLFVEVMQGCVIRGAVADYFMFKTLMISLWGLAFIYAANARFRSMLEIGS